MGRFTPDTIERVRDAVDMVELVGAKTDLRRVGSRWTGLCPFHDERTPSFSVDPAKKLYHCFGCGEGGDPITFVRQTEALEFPDAVELLAERYNVRVERVEDDPRVEARRKRKERLYSLLDRTARFYSTYLWESGEARKAREYLEGRGFSEDVLREFRVGYAPSAWDRVTLAARRDGFGQEELLAAGLAQQGRGGGVYDRFRGRIMFPLADSRGRVLGFGARAMGETRGPKYLNTSENDVYHKGSQLFGIDHAKPHAAKAGRVVVVEGYTDVLALHQAGLRESVAIMGTALTQEQLALLSQSARRVLLALDADRAGQAAMLRAARAAGDRDVELRVVAMPEGKDPADLLAEEGPDGFARRLEKAVSVLEFQVARVLADADLDTPAGRDRAFEEARPLIAATPERTAMRDELVRQVADRLDVPVTYVTTQMSGPQRAASERAFASVGKASLDAEREFLAMCLAGGELGREYFARLRPEHFSSEVDKRAFEHLASRLDDPLAGLPDEDPSLASVVNTIVHVSLDHEGVTEANMHMSFLGLETRRVERAITRANQEGDYNRQGELARAKQEVRREMDAVMGQTV
ncbi:MAG TPA: DNA primase [Thermoleophilaceae bacterium]|nr:DNA primase [Thermoleophilaceae bacterium]